ncbi:auxin-responsive protein IAA29-like isoform X1 [Cucurbita maxima]|uniref:Auxin-responsive protein n=1 Tax=Cucurbita maxima TaxID=3661 RepID=A0A6J1IY69_CUCMA|nr:auxin-responsive protein IAA29-like isoform X1 [Cucurbita maxima]
MNVSMSLPFFQQTQLPLLSLSLSLSLALPSCRLPHSLIHIDTHINNPKLQTKLPIRFTAGAIIIPFLLNYLKTGEILMELQLALALYVPDRTRGFDLNRNACDRDVFGSDPRSCVCEQSTSHGRHKRGFEDAFFKCKDSSKDLSLLLWSDRSNKEDDDRKDTNHRISCAIHINVGEENKVVGWPPIKSWRKRHLHQLQQDRLGSDQTHNHYWMEDNEDDGIVFNPKYVKVKMEGVAIARKIDVGLYSSYQTLKTALINMFSSSCYQKCGYSNDSLTLTYQDKEGDWMLAEDLPWQTFLESVQCMKIIRRQSSN